MKKGITLTEKLKDKEIIKKVRRGEWTIEGREFKGITHECKDLIKNLLTKDPKRRFSAKDALRHPWI